MNVTFGGGGSEIGNKKTAMLNEVTQNGNLLVGRVKSEKEGEKR